MLCGHPSTGREEYTRVKLKKDTHLLWTERKHTLHLKSNNELALYLIEYYYTFTSDSSSSVQAVISHVMCSSASIFCAN